MGAGHERGGHELDAPPWSRVEGTLMSAARAVRRAYDQRLAAIGLNLTEASVLAHLAGAGPLSQVEVARRIGTSRARVGAHIDGLEAKGAVRRGPHPTDRRVWMVELTADGRALWEQSVAIDQAVRKVLRTGTTAADRRQLDALLVRIQRNLDEQPG